MTKKILIVDDEEMIREAVRLSLDTEGYEIHQAPDGLKALEMARKLLPDLVLLDVMMPGMIGYRVCKELKSDPATSHIRVIFLTARGGSETEVTAKRSGADAVISKPFSPEQVRTTVKKFLAG